VTLREALVTIGRWVSRSVVPVVLVLKGIFTLNVVLCILAAQQLATLISRVRYVWVRVTTGLFLVILTSVLVFNGYVQWERTIAETHECRRGTGFPYIEVYIDSQELRGPIFDERYFINLGRDGDMTQAFRTVTQLKVIQSEMTPSGRRATFIFMPQLYNYKTIA
jgi:hypothetical protein